MKFKIALIIIFLFAFVLRFYKLSDFPIGLYSDETAYGYNAYSLLKTGKDEFGQTWPLTFKSFGDYKPPMSAWLSVPIVSIFGLNEFSTRAPSAFLGLLTVLVVILVFKEILEDNQVKKLIEPKKFFPLVAGLLLTISPWHLMFTRSSMLVGIEVFFSSLGFLLFLKSQKKPQLLFFSALAFSGAIYSYYGARVTVFLLLLCLALIFKERLLKIKNYVLGAILVGFLALLPLFISIYHDPSTLTGRARTISIFYDPGIRLRLWKAHTIDGTSYPTVLSRFYSNKPYFYFNDFFRRYFQHFSFDFLFVTGDVQTPFDIPKMGLVYLVDLPFFFYGLFLVFKIRTKKLLAVAAYLIVSPIAAGLTFFSPTANRSFNMVIPWTIISALGFVGIYLKINKNIKNYFVFGALLVYLVSFTFFLNIYFFKWPLEFPNMWHYGRDEMVAKVTKYEVAYKNVIISRQTGPAYIWLLFYKRYDPEKFRETVVVNDTPDELGWISVTSFDKYKFIKPLVWETIEKDENILYVGFEDEIPDWWQGTVEGKNLELKIVDRVFYPNGNVAFKLVKVTSF